MSYKIKDGRIISPGKFEGEREYVPEFWDLVMEGYGEEMEDGVVRVKIMPEQRRRWPELKGMWYVVMMENEQGFVVELKEGKNG